MELISVIVPVYNAEDYILTCLESLLSQTYKTLEIILIDDGSTDQSGDICDNYARKDNRIHVIHQENSGVSAARNVGLCHATGVYISYVDSDDYLKPDYFEYLYGKLQQYGVQMVCCNFTEMQNGKQVMLSQTKVSHCRLVTDGTEIFRDIASQTESYWSCVWGKLIRSDLAKKYRYPSFLKYGEDQVYMFDLFSTMPTVYLDTYDGYYYVRNDSSATFRKGEYSIPRCKDELAMHEYKWKNLPTRVSFLEDTFINHYAMGLQIFARAVEFSGTPEEKKIYREMVRSTVRNLREHRSAFSRRTKFYLDLYQSFPWIYRGVIRARDVIKHF